MGNLDLTGLSQQEKVELLNRLQADLKREDNERREAFEQMRDDFLKRVKTRFMDYAAQGKDFKNWLRGESESYFDLLREYGKLRSEDQLSFTVTGEDFKFIVKGNKVKGFDDRADIAEKRLVEFLRNWVKSSDKGESDPMYKLAMTMIQRNGNGDLDYKSISALYSLEDSFNDPEYSEIMNLFKESNRVENTVINFYFEEKNKYNLWQKVEPSFNRI